MWDKIKGKKTHILAAAGIVWSFVYYMQWIDVNTYLAVAGIFGFATQSTQRAAIKKVEEEIPPVMIRRS
jgi:hypothetical protein